MIGSDFLANETVGLAKKPRCMQVGTITVTPQIQGSIVWVTAGERGCDRLSLMLYYLGVGA